MESANQPLEDLKEIRKMMERSTRFLSLSGLSGISAGLVALAGSVIAFFLLNFQKRYFDPGVYFNIRTTNHTATIPWLILDGVFILIAALVLSYYFTRRKAKQKGLPIWDESTRRMLISMAFPLVTGGIFCLILLFNSLVFLVAPATLIFYGLSLVAASHFTLPELKYLGISEIALGLAASVFVGYGLIFWAMGFGILHIIYGYRMYVKYEQ